MSPIELDEEREAFSDSEQPYQRLRIHEDDPGPPEPTDDFYFSYPLEEVEQAFVAVASDSRMVADDTMQIPARLQELDET